MENTIMLNSKSPLSKRIRENESEWEWMGVNKSEWEWIRVNESEWEWSAWEWMRVNESEWEWLRPMNCHVLFWGQTVSKRFLSIQVYSQSVFIILFIASSFYLSSVKHETISECLN